MALLGIHDVIPNGRKDGRHLKFYSKFKLFEKTRKLPICFARVVKYDTIKHFPLLVAFCKFFIRKMQK